MGGVALIWSELLKLRTVASTNQSRVRCVRSECGCKALTTTSVGSPIALNTEHNAHNSACFCRQMAVPPTTPLCTLFPLCCDGRHCSSEQCGRWCGPTTGDLEHLVASYITLVDCEGLVFAQASLQHSSVYNDYC